MNILVTSGIKGLHLSEEETLQIAEALDKDIYPKYAKHMSVAFFVECVETMGETLTKQRMKHGN